MMTRFWSTNKQGYCLANTCSEVQGDLEHLLVTCPALDPVRHRLHSLWCLKTSACPPLHWLILKKLGAQPAELVKFILDPSACTEVLTLAQNLGPSVLELVMYLTRTWAWCIHRQKMILLDKWPGSRHHANKSTINRPDAERRPDTDKQNSKPDMTGNNNPRPDIINFNTSISNCPLFPGTSPEAVFQVQTNLTTTSTYLPGPTEVVPCAAMCVGDGHGTEPVGMAGVDSMELLDDNSATVSLSVSLSSHHKAHADTVNSNVSSQVLCRQLCVRLGGE